ncbi:hypothetical protein ACFL1X_08940 [Candidatus Hydrogenedentota bacterium]
MKVLLRGIAVVTAGMLLAGTCYGRTIYRKSPKSSRSGRTISSLSASKPVSSSVSGSRTNSVVKRERKEDKKSDKSNSGNHKERLEEIYRNFNTRESVLDKAKGIDVRVATPEGNMLYRAAPEMSSRVDRNFYDRSGRTYDSRNNWYRSSDYRIRPVSEFRTNSLNQGCRKRYGCGCGSCGQVNVTNVTIINGHGSSITTITYTTTIPRTGSYYEWNPYWRTSGYR